jgi:hypothetical protein
LTKADNYLLSLRSGLLASRMAIMSSVFISLNEILTNLFLNALDSVFLPE